MASHERMPDVLFPKIDIYYLSFFSL